MWIRKRFECQQTVSVIPIVFCSKRDIPVTPDFILKSVAIANGNDTYRLLARYFYHVLVLLLFVLLSSCTTHVSRPDGPPNFYVDETKIPNAVPKNEPLSKYGNKPRYYVFGKCYRVLPTSRNYEAVGIASWYGTKFHARKTSSGEKYDMLAMTAAHRFLPLPTYVEVTNLTNHRQVIVKVNDRGPFESNRIIDLSYVAAKKLGMLGRGTAYVRVRAIDPSFYGRSLIYANNNRQYRFYKASRFAQKQAPPTRSFIKHTSTKLVYLQVGAFRNKFHAEKLKKHLAAMLNLPITIANSSKLYKVQVGPIKDSAIVRLTNKLQDLGIKSSRVYGM